MKKYQEAATYLHEAVRMTSLEEVGLPTWASKLVGTELVVLFELIAQDATLKEVCDGRKGAKTSQGKTINCFHDSF